MNTLVSQYDIASVNAEEMEKPEDRTVRHISSEELTCSDEAKIPVEAIGKPYLKWGTISDKMLTNKMIKKA